MTLFHYVGYDGTINQPDSGLTDVYEKFCEVKISKSYTISLFISEMNRFKFNYIIF